MVSILLLLMCDMCTCVCDVYVLFASRRQMRRSCTHGWCPWECWWAATTWGARAPQARCATLTWSAGLSWSTPVTGTVRYIGTPYHKQYHDCVFLLNTLRQKCIVEKSLCHRGSRKSHSVCHTEMGIRYPATSYENSGLIPSSENRKNRCHLYKDRSVVLEARVRHDDRRYFTLQGYLCVLMHCRVTKRIHSSSLWRSMCM